MRGEGERLREERDGERGMRAKTVSHNTQPEYTTLPIYTTPQHRLLYQNVVLHIIKAVIARDPRDPPRRILVPRGMSVTKKFPSRNGPLYRKSAGLLKLERVRRPSNPVFHSSFTIHHSLFTIHHPPSTVITILAIPSHLPWHPLPNWEELKAIGTI